MLASSPGNGFCFVFFVKISKRLFVRTEYILILTITELLVDNASVPAGGPFTVLPLVDNASVTAGGSFIFCSTLLRHS